jgi:hypothetical protein
MPEPEPETDGIPVDIGDVSVPELQVDELPLDPPDFDDCEEGI